MNQGISFCASRDGTRIAWTREGQGPPLLRIPTWPMHLDFDRGSPVSAPWNEALASRHTLIRFDMRGTGLSDREVADVGFERWVEDLEAVADAAGLKQFALIGHSQGAAMGATYASRHPHRISRLILCGAYARGRLLRARNGADRERIAVFLQLIRVGWDSPDPVFRHVFSSLFLPDSRQEHLDAWDRLQSLACSAETAVRIAGVVDAMDVRAPAQHVRVPTLVFHAADDARVPLEEGRLFAGLVPEAQFVILPSRNHIWLPHEACWSGFVQRVNDFLAPQEQAPATATGTTVNVQPADDLTPREREVLELIARGQSNGQISDALGISPHTLRNHIARIFVKLGVSSRAQAIVGARQVGYGRGA